MQGIPDFNYPAFNTAAALLRDARPEEIVINPAEFFDGDWTHPRESYLRYGLSELAMHANAVVLLSGWESSDGVRAELDLADSLGIPAYTFPDYFHHVTQGMPLPEPVTRDPFDTDTPLELPTEVPPRADVLQEAAALITGDRNAQYGSPKDDFGRSVGMWNSLGYRGPGGRELKPSDLSILLICVKLSRATWMNKRDNWTDIGGYAGCGYEVSLDE
jgi:hypothetical protein